MAEPTYLKPGVVLQDRYEIADEIGRGGFSIAYRARDRGVGANSALSRWQAGPVQVEGTDTLAGLVQDMGEEGRRQEAAAREIAELLA